MYMTVQSLYYTGKETLIPVKIQFISLINITQIMVSLVTGGGVHDEKLYQDPPMHLKYHLISRIFKIKVSESNLKAVSCE